MLADHKQIDKKATMRNPKQKYRLGSAGIEITLGLQLECGRPTLDLRSALVPQTLSCSVCVEGS